MMDVSQIIAAMMSQRPDVTQMSPLGVSGGGSPRGRQSSQIGSGLDMSFGQQRGPVAAPEMPEIMGAPTQDPMQMVQPPGYSGSPLQGPPDPAQAYQPSGAAPGSQVGNAQPGIQALEKQYFDAVQEVDKYANPRRLKDAYQAADKLPVAQEKLAVATSNINAYNKQYEAQQQRQQQDARARQVFEMTSSIYGPERGRQLADAAWQSEDAYQEIMKSGLEQLGVYDERRFDQSEEVNREFESAAAMIASGVPSDIAEWLSKSKDMSPDQAAEMYWANQDRVKEASDTYYRNETAKANALAQVDNQIHQLNKTMDYAGGFGATGLISVLAGQVPGTDAYRTAKSIDTQRAAAAFKELLDMRRASETGGALGNVSNREIELLYSAFTSLDPGMGDAFVSNLADVLQRYERVKYMLQNEDRFKQDDVSGEDMHKQATEYVNKRTAAAMNTPMEALNDLYNGKGTEKQFRDTFGWSPMTEITDAEYRDMYGGTANVQ